MKIEVIKIIKHKEVIDIELPFFYKNEYNNDDSEWMTYGRVESDKVIEIDIQKSWINDGDSYKIEIREAHPSESACYFSEEHKSTKDEFMKARDEMIAILQKETKQMLQ